MLHPFRLCALVLLALGAAAVHPLEAAVLLDETNLVGTSGAAAPSNYSFTVTSPQALTLTLRDLQLPAPFSALAAAVTLGDSLVGTATLSAATPNPTINIPAAAGTYTVHVAGAPSSALGGSFGVCVAPQASPTSCIGAFSYSGNLFTPTAPSTTASSSLDTSFTSTVAGTYTVTITDDQFPAPLQMISGGIANGATPVVQLAAGTTQVTLTADTAYTLIVGAVASATTTAGLYGIEITDPTGAPIFNRTLPVGTLQASTVVDNPAAQNLMLSLTDYEYAAPLASLGAAVTQGSQALATLDASGSVGNITAAAGPIEIWQYAVGGAGPGSYGLTLSYQTNGAAATNLLATTQVVNSSAQNTSYAFVATLPAAGTYKLVVNDFQFPAALGALGSTVAQNGTQLAVTNGEFTGQAGPVVIIISATLPAAGLGIFGVTVETTAATPTVILDQTQAIGGIFTTSTINLGTSGNFAVTLADLAFPQKFSNLAVVVSQNSEVLGKIYGGGVFQFAAVPGQYVVTFVALPSSTTTTPPSLATYGLYSLNIGPAAPTVTLSASATSVTTGATVTLTWSSTSTTSCTASGATGWTGPQATSGSLAVQVAGNSTYALSCTGAGGSAEKSVAVEATPATSSGGGGGSLNGSFLAVLAAIWALRLKNRRVGLPACR
jgi:hypothetical protein